MMLSASLLMEEQGSPARVPTILLLDDDSNTLLVLHAILEQIHAEVIECENAACAMRWCEEPGKQIDVLVSDVILEGSNGPAVVRKARPSQPAMKLLFISGFSLPDLQQRGLLSPEEMADGLVEFLQKPFSRDELLRRVTRLLEKDHLREQPPFPSTQPLQS